MAKSALGIAVGPGFIHVAEVSFDIAATSLVRVAAFTFSDGDTLDKPVELGKKFDAFLKENKFTAKRAVAGLPTQWLMLKMKTVPTMSAENLAGMLRLQAERDFSLDPNDLVLDYITGESESSEGGSRSLLLTAALNTRVEQIRAVLKTAGLNAVALTSSALTLASACSSGTVFCVGSFGAELITLSQGNVFQPSVLGAIQSKEGEWLAPIVAEARRGLAMRASDPSAPVAVWNSGDLSAQQIKQLSTDLKVTVQTIDRFPSLDFSVTHDATTFGHAIALAQSGKDSTPNTLNFFDSKLVEKVEGLFAKFRPWMAVAALVVVGLVGWLGVTWYKDSSELDKLSKEADVRKTETKSAKAFVSHFASTQGWYDKRPNMLECLKELADVIPSDGGAWMTKLSVKDDFRCEMSAKAVTDKRYFEVFDHIEKHQSFRDVKLVYMNKQDKKSSEVAFAISFIFWKQ
ncbi:MAG: hypothetical protein WCT04_07035 [Planctomycetota bacterium]